jgi:hypothetical protein
VRSTACLHRKSDIVLAVDAPCDPCDGRPGHELLDEDDATTPGTVDLAAHVEAEIDLFEARVEGDRDPEHARSEELKPHNADERATEAEIELAPGGNAPL